MYKKVFAERNGPNKHKIHLWTDEGYEQIEWVNYAYKECPKEDATHIGLKGEPLYKTKYYSYNPWKKFNPNTGKNEFDPRNDEGLHFIDIKAHQKFLIEKYGTNDEISTTHRELFFDIETEMLDSLTEEGIREAPKKVTSIAWYDKQVDEWGILILDSKNQLKHTKAKNKEITPVRTEDELLAKFLEKFREIDPDILVGYNSDYFDIPYLYYRMCRVLGKDWAKHLSPIGKIKISKPHPRYKGKTFQEVKIIGVESLDYMRLHKKYSWADEPSWKLDDIGEKYAGMNKVEYEGSLDKLFEEDIHKFIRYNFVDVEILVKLDGKLEYIALTKNLSHKGKHNYSEVYANTNTQDGAISAYLLSIGIVPPNIDHENIKEEGYAGGYLFCPKAGIYNYMFDEDLTSLYPSIIMSLNIGKETLVGWIVDADDRNSRLGLDDLKKRDPEEEILLRNPKGVQARFPVSTVIRNIEGFKFTLSANGTMFRTKQQSVLSIILAKWFNERVYYKEEMKKAYQAGNKELGASFHMKQYTFKILLNSLYGATALPSFRYGNVVLSKAITLTGQRIIQESALYANSHMNKVMKGEIELC